jgi:hypothetical protein
MSPISIYLTEDLNPKKNLSQSKKAAEKTPLFCFAVEEEWLKG